MIFEGTRAPSLEDSDRVMCCVAISMRSVVLTAIVVRTLAVRAHQRAC